MIMAQPQPYLSVQALRGVAVFVVIWFHASVIWPVPVYINLPVLDDLGWLAVRLFFVLSGFIIADRIAEAPSLRMFLLRRYLRVLPLNVLATLAALGVSLAVGGPIYTSMTTDSGAPYAPGPLYLLKSLLIVPQDEWPYLFLGWSLEFEIVFYLVFGVLFFTLARRAATLIFIAISLLLWITKGFGLDVTQGYYVYFAVGLIAREWLRHDPPSMLTIPLAGLAVAIPLARSLWGMDFGAAFIPLTASGFMGVLVLAMTLERRGQAFTRPGWWSRLGDISFSAYLTHALVVNFLGFLARGWLTHPLLAEGARLFTVWVSLIASAWVFHRFERPIRRYIAARLKATP